MESIYNYGRFAAPRAWLTYNQCMSYAVAVERLHALGAELAPTPSGAVRRKFDLEQMRQLTAALGNPEARFPSVLIAGTNGKGSTAAMLGSILSCAGYRTGLYTSPHLQRVNERIQVSGTAAGENTLANIGDLRFAQLYFRVEDAATRLVDEGKLPYLPSFFEVLTAMAFLAFADEQVDIAVLEVGLGGRLDATNVVEPILSVITDIALDHTEWLGSTLAEIAREKAGILRKGGSMVILPQHPDVNFAIGTIAVELGVTGINAADYLPGRSSDPTPVHHAGLQGSHQQRNSALAIAAATYLQHSKEFKDVTQDAFRRGLEQVRWPGRLEMTTLPSGRRVLLDVAHNPAGAWSLRSYLSQAFEDGSLVSPRTLIFSAYRDKAIQEMAQILFPLFDSPGDRVVVVPMDGPRAATAGELLTIAAHLETRVTLAATVAEALALGDTNAGSTIVTGSVHLIGDVKDALDAMLVGETA